MDPIGAVFLFFAVLACLIAGAALAQKKSARVISALAAFAWACLMFVAASWAERFNYNIWYSHAASKMLKACIGGIEQGRQDVVLRELQRMTNELDVTYERRGNFNELAESVAANLSSTNGKATVPADAKPSGRAQ